MNFLQQSKISSNIRRIHLILLSLCLIWACNETSDKNTIKHELAESITTTDGAQMQLIPSGKFQMGNHHRGTGDTDEFPVHTVFLDAFYIDTQEVTNARYQQFIVSTGYHHPPLWHDPKFNKPEDPVVNVFWKDAVAYANWAQKRLPTEAEWEYAARGALIGKRYPSGDIITHSDANFSGIEGNDIWRWTSPVGSFPPNSFGLYDMAGNVWEWCFDEYNEHFYSTSSQQNPRFGRNIAPDSENFRILRGGGWGGGPDDLRVSDRWYHLSSGSTIGFRCVKDIYY